jgi:hypothetical protein
VTEILLAWNFFYIELLNCRVKDQLNWDFFSFFLQEMLLVLLPLLNSASVKKYFSPFSKDKSNGTADNEVECPVCHSFPSIPFVALPCQHRWFTFLIIRYFLMTYIHMLPKAVVYFLIICSFMSSPGTVIIASKLVVKPSAHIGVRGAMK